jgi:alpha-beta hydrolase superfamily lysophospholipase
MFEYFPDNYNWSLAVSLAIAMGGEMSEIDSACRPLRGLAAGAVDDATQQAWFDSWTATADRLDELAARDEAAGRLPSAARKRRRACAYHLMAERMMTNLSPLKTKSYAKALAAFRAATCGLGKAVEFLEVPYADGPMPALFIAAEGTGPRPCLVFFNGFDVTKEVLYLMEVGDLASRGMSVLLCDQPGSGGALRLHGQPTRFDMEVPAAACFEAMAARPDVDSSRIAIGGISMGGYFAPRAASVDHRFAACIAWGAFHDLIGVAANLVETGAHSAPPFQAPWVFGTDMDSLREIAPSFNLDPVIAQMTCPLLVVHGESDRQVPVAQARRTHDMAASSPRRDLIVFPKGAWGEEHCQVDDPTLAIDAIGDWLQEVLR